jgi:hypothetical protein
MGFGCNLGKGKVQPEVRQAVGSGLAAAVLGSLRHVMKTREAAQITESSDLRKCWYRAQLSRTGKLGNREGQAREGWGV